MSLTNEEVETLNQARGILRREAEFKSGNDDWGSGGAAARATFASDALTGYLIFLRAYLREPLTDGQVHDSRVAS